MPARRMLPQGTLARLALVALGLLLGACTRAPGDLPAAAASASIAPAPPALALPGLPGRDPGRGFARLPDRGELIAYPARAPQRTGAYTWYRADLSEAYALRAIAERRLRVTAPDGSVLEVAYDRRIEHPSGDWTWIGHLPGQPGAQTILTFGADAAFGTIAQPGKPPLRLAVRNGVSWLVQTDPARIAGIVNAATRPHEPDYKTVLQAALPQAGRAVASAPPPPLSAGAGPAAATTVDVVLGYTPGFVANSGGTTSAAVTRLNYLVDVANTANANSQVDAQVRLVKALLVNYTDSSTNDSTLEKLTGYKSGVGEVTPDPAFNALRAAREQYGADLVSLVRKFTDPEQDGCGIAWLLGGGQQGIGPGEGWDYLGYSVVGDGEDLGTDGKTYYCRDETLAHELGHNMGSAHDKEAAEGDDGVLNSEDYGAYLYSFGYKTTATEGNFYTVMAYGDKGQTGYRVFSNPRITFCGGRACGIANVLDNARSLSQTSPVVAGFRATVVTDPSPDPDPPPPVARILLRQLDGNGDGASDLMFFNHGLARVSSWYMRGSSRLAVSSFALGAQYRLVDAADFDGDGSGDLLFTSPARDLKIAFGTGNGPSLQTVANVYASNLQPIAAADINGNGKADIVLRDAATGKVVVWYMAGATRTAYNSHGLDPSWEFVGAGDLNGDGRQDLLWTNAARQLLLGTSLGTSFGNQVLGLAYQAGYTAAGVQDVNGDGRADILLTKDDGLRLVTWFMNGATRTAYSSTTTSASDTLVGKGDFNGDRRGDLVMMNPATRRITLQLSTGSFFSASSLALVPQSGSDLMDVPLP